MKPAPLFLVAAGVIGLTGCAGNTPPREPPAAPPARLELEPVETEIEREFVRGLVFLKLGDYGAATEAISHVARTCPTAPIGAQALLTLITVELDPRNPDQDPAAARRLAEQYIALPTKPAWTEPAIETLYLVAIDLGGGTEVVDEPTDFTTAAEDQDRGATGEIGAELGGLQLSSRAVCDVANGDAMVGRLIRPALPDEPVVDRMAGLERDKVALSQRVAALEAQLTQLQQELKRIRQTLKP